MEYSDQWNPSIYRTRLKLSLSHEWSKKPVVGPMAILKLLLGLSRMNHSFVLSKERCRIEVIGNAIFARHERLDHLPKGS
jgi:hypothetical protein